MRLKQHRPTAGFALTDHGHALGARRFRQGVHVSWLRSALMLVLLSTASMIAAAGTFATAARASAGTAYVTNFGSASVTPIDLATGKAGEEIKVGGDPTAIAIIPDGKTAYVVNENNNSVTPIEVATNKAGAEIKVGLDPKAIAITPDGKTAYVTNDGEGTVTPIELATNKAGAEINVGGHGGHGIAIAPDGKTAYVATSSSVTPIEVATNKAGAEIKVGSYPTNIAITPGKSSLPWGIAMDPTSGNLCVTEVGNDRVQEFSSAGSFVLAFGSSGSGAGQLSGPKGLAVNSSGTVFVADSGNKRIEEWVLSP